MSKFNKTVFRLEIAEELIYETRNTVLHRVSKSRKRVENTTQMRKVFNELQGAGVQGVWKACVQFVVNLLNRNYK